MISFLDSNIVRLNRFAGSTSGIEEKTAVICFPEQVPFVRKIVGPRVKIKTVTLDMVEDALTEEGCDAYE